MTLRAAALFALAGALGLSGCINLANPARERFSISDAGPEETGNIGVNAYLWRASLDTLDFMPLESADPWGGVIITEWYAPPETPDERFKVTVYILDTRLRADGVSSAVTREVRSDTGEWVTGPVTTDTRIAIENAILTRARDLRLSTIDE